MTEPRQLNVRVPDEARDLMTTIAARLRHDEGFADRLAAWLETLDDPTADDTLAERVARLEAWREAIEGENRDPNEPNSSRPEELPGAANAPTTPETPTTPTDTPRSTPQREAEDARTNLVEASDEVPHPFDAPQREASEHLQTFGDSTLSPRSGRSDTPTDTPPRGAPENVRKFFPGSESPPDTPHLTTGEGKSRRLTKEGIVEVERRIQAGENDKAISKAVGVGVGTVQKRRKVVEARLL